MTKESNVKVSVIIPVYNTGEYLERCINSLVNQTIKDIEIVIVNDGSTDNSQSIIDKCVKLYPNLIKAYSITNGGAANARNFAIDKATGEYIGFVDSDDYVSLDMYEKLYQKAIQENADISTCGYYRKIDERCLERDTKASNDFGYSIYESPNILIDSVPYIWNKIFKRTLIEENNIKFNNLRIYEDLIFTYELFANANKISKVFEPLYFYIVTREDSLTYGFTDKRYDIFKAFEILIDYMKQKGSFEELKEELLFILLKHIYVVFEKDSTKENAKLKIKYIDESFEFLNKNFPDWRSNCYYTLYRKNIRQYTSKSYWKMRVYVSNDKRNKIDKMARTPKRLWRKFVRQDCIGHNFVKYMNKPIKEKAILLNSQQGNNINGNMFYILKELQTNEAYKDYKIYVAYKKGKKEEFKEKLQNYNFKCFELIDINSKKYAEVLATTKYLFNDTSFPIYYIKRDGQIYLNTWHGTPLKTLGKATANDFYDIANLQKNFVVSDYLLYPNEYMMDIMLRDYMLNDIIKNKILLCGYPRNEIFFNSQRRSEIKEELNVQNKQVIAYMPTWRGQVRNVSLKEQLEQVQEYLQEIDSMLNDEQIMYVNLHPYVGDKLDCSEFKHIVKFSQRYETYDFLNIADILITDYSSVFFDYAVTKNKVILFNYDEEDYMRERGMYIDLKDLPFPKVKSVKELINEINLPKQYDETEFLNTYAKYECADISKQICDKVILGKESAIKEIEPKVEKNKPNVLVYAGSLNKCTKTDNLIEMAKNTNFDKRNYYISYITRNVRRNKRQLRDLANSGMSYMGQLGNLSNMGKMDKVVLALAGRKKKLYNKFENRVDSICKNELKRVYANIDFEGVILYSKIGYRKIVEFSNIDCKKVLCLTADTDINRKVSKKVYSRFDNIYVTNPDILEEVKMYCGNDKRVKLLEKIDSLEDIKL